jgi:catechol 2,3-dioxygenase-like lactoylglutathione lyase family enzyme
MSDSNSPLPARPSLDQLRKLAKERLAELRATKPETKLAHAQLSIAREHGFDSWPKLVDHVSTVNPLAAEPEIVAPVSRWLGARDVNRTVAFWTGVLGFTLSRQAEGGDVELTSGRARIRFGDTDHAPDFSTRGRAPGSAITFFDTNDVAGMHAAVRQRGGEPSELEKVNWLKRRVFEVRDPDGHVIWFGQSYHAKSAERSRRMMRQIMPELPCDDVAASVRHYRDVLGFSVNYEQDDLGVMDCDEVRLLLIKRTREHRGIGSASFYVRDADALHTELVRSGADVQGSPVSQPWGLREFSVLDPDGNRLTFAQTFE